MVIMRIIDILMGIPSMIYNISRIAFSGNMITPSLLHDPFGFVCIINPGRFFRRPESLLLRESTCIQ